MPPEISVPDSGPSANVAAGSTARATSPAGSVAPTPKTASAPGPAPPEPPRPPVPCMPGMMSLLLPSTGPSPSQAAPANTSIEENVASTVGRAHRGNVRVMGNLRAPSPASPGPGRDHDG